MVQMSKDYKTSIIVPMHISSPRRLFSSVYTFIDLMNFVAKHWSPCKGMQSNQWRTSVRVERVQREVVGFDWWRDNRIALQDARVQTSVTFPCIPCASV